MARLKGSIWPVVDEADAEVKAPSRGEALFDFATIYRHINNSYFLVQFSVKSG